MSEIKCPWLGFKPYGEEDAPFFNGRSKAIKDLLDIVESKTITVCYAESGTGKTSLINAGIVPNLREKRFLPIWIRFDIKAFEGKTKEEIREILCDHIISVLCETKKGFEEKNRPYKLIWDLPDEKQKVKLIDLWKALRSTPKVAVSFNDFEYYNVYKPFLILDQFEQMLYDSNSQLVIESFFELLKSLVLNDTFSDEYLQMKEKGLVKDSEDLFKVLVSLRQEYIGVLDYWCMARVPMPSLHDNRFSLQPLTTQEARTVILPKGYEIFENAIDQIIEIAKENNSVSSILLSVVCRRLFEQAPLEGDKKKQVTDVEVEKKKETIIRDYYDEQLKKAQNGNESLLSDKLVSQIEDVLVIDDGKNGKRSLLAVKNDLLQGIVFTENIKLLLENNGIIRSDRIGQTTFVELIHDKVAGAVLERKKERRNQKAKEERRKANYQKFISRQNPLTLGGRRIWDNKTFSFSLDNSRTNSLQNSSNRTENTSTRAKNISNRIDNNSANGIKNASNGTGLQSELLQQPNNDEGGVEQLFFDKLFSQVSNEGSISLDFGENYSRDGISGFEIHTIRIKEQIKIKQIDFYRKEKSNESLDYEKVPAYTLDGFCGIRSEYDKETGDEIKRTYICDGYTSVGIASIEFGDFKGGLPQKAMYFDSKGNPCKHIDGNYGVKIYYDDYGREKCRKFLDLNENFAPIYNGVCGVVSIYDSDDRVIKQYFIDKDRKRIFDYYHNHGVRYEYHDERNKYLVTETYYVDCNDPDDSDVNKSHIDNPQGYCKEQLQYDDKWRIIKQLYYNKNGVEVEKKDGDYYYSKLNVSYDNLERIEKIEMCNLFGSVNKIIKYSYYPNGAILECSYYEKNNYQEDQVELKSISADNAVHKIGYKYTNSGLLKSQEYYDRAGNLMEDSNKFCKIDFEYNDLGFVSKFQYYKLEDVESPILKITYEYNNNGTCKITRQNFKREISKELKMLNPFVKNPETSIEYIPDGSPDTWHGIINQRGELVKEFYDENNEYIYGTPLTVRRKYDIDGKVVEELFYDKNDISPICSNKGLYGWQIEYDIKTGEECKRILLRGNNKIIVVNSIEEYEGKSCNVICYFDEENNPVLCESGYHKKLTSQSDNIDELNSLVAFLDCHNQPCDCKDGYSKQLFEEEKINNQEIRRTVCFIDANGAPRINKERGFHKREQIISIEKNMETCRLFKDENDNLINVPEGFAKQTCKRYDSFWTWFHFPFTDHDVIRFYDKNEQKVNVDYETTIKGELRTFHAYKFVTPLDYSSFFKVKNVLGDTLYIDRTIMWKCVFVILVPLAIIVALVAYPFYYLFNKVINIFKPKRPVQDSTCSIVQVAQVFDEVQKGNESMVSPAKSMGIKDGCWIVKWNDWVYNKYDTDTIEKFETEFNVAAELKSITLYNPDDKRFFNLYTRERNLGLRLQDAQVPVNSVNEMMENAMSLSPDENAEFLRIIYSNIARQYKESGEYDKAEKLYHKQIAFMEQQGDGTSQHDLADAYDDLGVCLFKSGKNNDAIEMMKKAISIVGISEDDILLTAAIHNHLAQIYRTNEQFEEAEFHYKESAKRIQGVEGISNDIVADRMMDIGVMLARQEKYDECIEETEKALMLTSDKNSDLLQSVHSNLAYLYKKKGEYVKAEKHYREQIVIMEKQKKDVSRHDLADAYDDLGVCLYLLDRNDEAIDMFERALKIVGKEEGEEQLLVAIHSHFAQAFQDDNKYKKAEHHYKKCISCLETIEGTPGDILADYLMKLGVTLARQEKYSVCLDVTERALSLVSVDNFALLQKIHSNLAYLYKEKREFDKAERHYREQIAIIEKQGEEVSPHNLADAYDDLGVFLFQIDRNNEAIEALEHALKIIGDNEDEIYLIATIHNHLAQIYQDGEDPEKAEIHKKEFDRLKEEMDKKRDVGQSEDSIAQGGTNKDES